MVLGFVAMTTTIQGIDGLKERVGDHLGYSEWHQVTQEQVNTVRRGDR